MSEKQFDAMSSSEKKKEDWMNSKWRPMMGWMYMGICCFDFVLAPIMWSVIQAIGHGQVNVQWQPLTLQGAGLFHVAMGAVLGIAALGRTQEKLAGANNGGLTGTTYTPPSNTGMGMNNNMGMSGMNSGMNNSMGMGMNNNMGMSGMNSGMNNSMGMGMGSSMPSPSFGSSPMPSPSFPAPSPVSSSPLSGPKPLGPSQSFPPL
jgi:hypothetical protein